MVQKPLKLSRKLMVLLSAGSALYPAGRSAEARSGPGIRQQSATVGLVMLTMHLGDDQIFTAMEAGASAFVGKDAPSTDVVGAARHAYVSPRTFLCTGLAAAMMRRATDDRPRLSEREREVLELLADGLGTAAIAGKLFMSESTAKTHIARIYQKLGATNRAQALVTSMRLGLLSAVRPD